VTRSRIDEVLAEVRRQLPHRPTADEVPALRARGALLVDIRPVEQRRDVAFLEPVELDERCAQVLDVVDAPSEIRSRNSISRPIWWSVWSTIAA